MNSLTEQREGNCEYCGSKFTYEFWMFEEKCCPTCLPSQEIIWAEEERIADIEREKKDKEEFQRKAQDRWSDLIPDRFQKTDLAHPEFRKPLYDRVCKWRPSDPKPFAGLVGQKGVCKTRIAALRMLHAMQNEEGIRRRDYETGMYSGDYSSRYPLFVTSYEFSRAVVDQYSDEKGEKKAARRLIRNAEDASFLVFDDMGKARSSPAVIAALFAMIDYRHAHNLFTIWTANSTPEEFCEGMPPDVAGPLVRRLKEASTLFAIQ